MLYIQQTAEMLTVPEKSDFKTGMAFANWKSLHPLSKLPILGIVTVTLLVH